MQLKFRVALLALMQFSAAAAWAATVMVDTVEISGKSVRGVVLGAGQVAMPFIRSNNAAVAAQINDALFIAELGMLAPKNPGKVVAAGHEIEPVAQTFTVSGKHGPILSVHFEIEGCGAYCETYHSVHHFDTSNGRRVNDDDIVTDGGKRALVRRMVAQRLSRFTDQSAMLATQLVGARQKEGAADIEERLAFFSECAERERERLADESDVAAAFGYYTQQHENKTLVLTSGRCSNHAMRALDDVGDVSMSFPYAELRPYLTGYGKALLLGEGRAKATSVYRQLLRGHLNGNIAITMQLANERGNSINGVYIYDKVGKQIKLVGKREGNELTLTERLGDEGHAGATMKLLVSDGQLTGQWIGKKQLRMRLAVP